MFGATRELFEYDARGDKKVSGRGGVRWLGEVRAAVIVGLTALEGVKRPNR